MSRRSSVLLIENSLTFTGAFKCAMQQAILMKEKYRFVFIISIHSELRYEIEKEGFTVYQLPLLEIRKDLITLLKYIPRLLLNTRSLKRIILIERANLIIVNDFYNLLGVTLKSVNKNIGLITYVRFLPQALSAPFRKVWTYLGKNNSDRLIAVSDAVLNQLPISHNTIRLYDAIHFNEVLPVKTYLPASDTTFLYLGNYIKGKGQDHALQAFIRVHNVNPNTRLIYAGGDMNLEKNKLFKQQLQETVIRNGLQEVVEFLTFVPDVEPLIKMADVVLNFSEAESFSMTVAEACYYGVAVIATKCGGPEEIIVHEETGLLVENKHIDQMVNAMIRLIQDKSLQAQFGKKAREYVQTKFSEKNYIKACAQVYDQVLEGCKHAYGN